MEIRLYPPSKQASGIFDGGKITEQKPIGFPGEGSAVKRLGPLFYWSWFHTEQEGAIPLHPHRGFEIITYMMNGKAEHCDSLGTKSMVCAGGIQVMQTGSGIYHQERMIGPDDDGFQIWFEPHLREAFNRVPTYRQYAHCDLPVSEREGIWSKTVIGEGSPVELVTKVQMLEVKIDEGKTFTFQLKQGNALAILAYQGNGTCQGIGFQERDFIVVQGKEASVNVELCSHLKPIHFLLIQVPINVNYPLYPNR